MHGIGDISDGKTCSNSQIGSNPSTHDMDMDMDVDTDMDMPMDAQLATKHVKR